LPASKSRAICRVHAELGGAGDHEGYSHEVRIYGLELATRMCIPIISYYMHEYYHICMQKYNYKYYIVICMVIILINFYTFNGHGTKCGYNITLWSWKESNVISSILIVKQLLWTCLLTHPFLGMRKCKTSTHKSS
jgi:hypothetical protein